jgi:hypothetical protein
MFGDNVSQIVRAITIRSHGTPIQFHMLDEEKAMPSGERKTVGTRRL